MPNPAFPRSRRAAARALRSLALAALLTATACASKTRPHEPAAATPAPQITYDREKTLESFEVVWQTINDKHWDPDHNGVDWNAVHDEFRPKVEAANSMAEARDLIEEMIARLGQSHFGVWPQEVYLRDPPARSTPTDASADGAHEPPPQPPAEPEEILARPGKDRGVSGLEVRMVNDQALITRVAPDSPAAAAGITPGWILLSANDQSIERLARRLDQREKLPVSRELALTMMIRHLLAGDVGDTLELTLLDGSDQTTERDLTLAETTATPARLGNLPTFYLSIDSRRLPENVQYFRFSAFFDPPRLMREFQTAVEGAADADGFIIDLRGNPGGIGGLAMGMGGWFVTEDKIKLGTMISRNGTINFILNPRLRAYTGPLAILIDPLSASTSEIFAGGMKDIRRARIFGERSAGAALPSVIDRLPNGDRFQYAIANYISFGGEPLEGQGVEPHEVVVPDRQSLLAGRDPVLDAALRWIASRPHATDAAGAGTN